MSRVILIHTVLASIKGKKPMLFTAAPLSFFLLLQIAMFCLALNLVLSVAPTV